MEQEQPAVCVWFNPGCSKCRGAKELLDEQGVEADYLEYLHDTPSKAEIERVLGLLGFDDPRSMMRTGEAVYADLGLGDDGVERDTLLEAMVANPILIERPIVVGEDWAVIARPPERLREFAHRLTGPR
jgi:arsenate reductase